MKITSTFLQFFFIIFSLLISVRGQSAGDFQSYQTGDWNNVNTWERYNGTSWINPAPSTPAYSDGVITIQSPHTVTVTVSVTIDQTTINSSGYLTINSGITLTLYNGTGTDLIINGTATIDGTLNRNSNSSIIVNGSVINAGSFSGSKTDVSFAANSLYQHNRNGGTVTNAAWDVNSSCEITGVTTTLPSQLKLQSFGNFTWNCPNQTMTGSSLGTDFGTSTYPVQGNFTMQNTGTGKCYFTSSAQDQYINGNFIMSGGTLEITHIGGANRTVYVGGDFSMSGGKLILSESSLIGTMNIPGNFSHTGGTITETSSGSGAFVFSKSGIQSYTSGGTISNTVNFTVNGGSTLQMASASSTITGGGSFTLSSGATLGITSSDGITTSGASSNIQVTGTRTYNTGANYTYNGTASQNMGNGFPTNLTGTLTIDNSGNTVTLDNPRTIANGGLIVLTAGTFEAGSNLTMASTSSITVSGSDMTGTPQGSGTYNITYTGNSKTSGTELSGSGLNNLTLNLNSGQTLILDQSRTVAGTLMMTSGNINAGANTLTLGTSTSSLGSLSRTTGTIIGNFQRWFAASSVSNVLFPMGTASNYRPANISFTVAPSTGGTLTAFFTASDPGTTGLPLDDVGTSIVDAGKEGYWTITAANGLSGGAYSLDLTADGFSGVSVVSTLRLIKRSTGGSWSLDGSHSAGTGTTSIPVVHRTDMSGFSEFGIGGASDNPFPVELSSFSAIINDKSVILNWRTETETNNYGFEVQKSGVGSQESEWANIGFVEGHGNSNSPKEYSFIDGEVKSSGNYYYRLKQIDNDGRYELSEIINVNFDLPAGFTLRQNFPNPFNPSTTISFSLPINTTIVINVYNSLGEKVAEIFNGSLEAGYHQVEFNASSFPSGVYFYRFESEQFAAIKKMILVR